MSKSEDIHPTLHALGINGQHNGNTKHGHLRNVHEHLHKMSTKELKALHREVHRNSKHHLSGVFENMQAERAHKASIHK